MTGAAAGTATVTGTATRTSAAAGQTIGTATVTGTATGGTTSAGGGQTGATVPTTVSTTTLPLSYEMAVFCGATFTHTFCWKPDGATPQDFTGWTASMKIGQPHAVVARTLLSPAAGLTLSSLGLVVVTLTAVETAALGPGRRYTYDLDLVDPSSAVTRFLRGHLTAVQGVGSTGPVGPGEPPDTGDEAFVHTQSTAATVWTVTHELGYDPAGVLVIDTDGYVRDGCGVQILVSGTSLRLSFDIAIAGVAYFS